MSLDPTRSTLLCALSVCVLNCGTTEQEVADQIEVLAANQIHSQAWNQAVEELVAIGRPAARQLIGLLDPAKYKGEGYRSFRDEIENTRTGAAVVLGRIQHKAASANIDDRITVAYRYNERVAGMRAMGDLGFTQVAVTALKTQLKDLDPVIRLHAATAMVKMDEHQGVDEIRGAITSDDPALAEIAVEELARSNYFGAPLLAELTAMDGPYQERLGAAVAKLRQRLVEQLVDDDPEIRLQAAAALGTVGDASVTEALRVVLEDKSNLVRFSASSSLSKLGDAMGTDFLFTAMGSSDPVLRVNAVKSLVQVQLSSGVVEERLISSLQAEDPYLRSAAAQVLGQARVADALHSLLPLVDDAVADVRWNALIALGNIAAPESRQLLERVAGDEDATVAYYAEWALQQVEGEG